MWLKGEGVNKTETTIYTVNSSLTEWNKAFTGRTAPNTRSKPASAHEAHIDWGKLRRGPTRG